MSVLSPVTIPAQYLAGINFDLKLCAVKISYVSNLASLSIPRNITATTSLQVTDSSKIKIQGPGPILQNTELKYIWRRIIGFPVMIFFIFWNGLLMRTILHYSVIYNPALAAEGTICVSV